MLFPSIVMSLTFSCFISWASSEIEILSGFFFSWKCSIKRSDYKNIRITLNKLLMNFIPLGDFIWGIFSFLPCFLFGFFNFKIYFHMCGYYTQNHESMNILNSKTPKWSFESILLKTACENTPLNIYNLSLNISHIDFLTSKHDIVIWKFDTKISQYSSDKRFTGERIWPDPIGQHLPLLPNWNSSISRSFLKQNVLISSTFC